MKGKLQRILKLNINPILMHKNSFKGKIMWLHFTDIIMHSFVVNEYGA